jgi:hypothetical protein
MPEYRTFLPGETLTDDELQDLGLQFTYTPSLTASTTNPTLGTGGTVTADGILRQGFVKIRFNVLFGSAGVAAGSGTYQLSLPTVLGVPLGIDADWASQHPIGKARLRDSSVPTIALDWHVVTDLSFADKIVVKNDTGGAVTNAVPWTWAANDTFQGILEYKTDFA